MTYRIKNFRYRKDEVELMKRDILIHINSETVPDKNGNKSAWRLHLSIEGCLLCCRNSKRSERQLIRKLNLYEALTKDNMPNF